MAKSKLTKEAIIFIVETYDSQTENYTYSEIANLVRDKYRINVSIQAVQKNYYKYKGGIEVSSKNELSEKEEHLQKMLNL